MKKLKLTGQKIGRLTVLSEVAERRHAKVLWECLCDCGNTSVVYGSILRRGDTKSCGCLQHEISTKHGKSSTPEYQVWKHMIRRCTDKNYKRYKDYGGRGIKVCERWLDVNNFIADMGDRPPGLTIERRDNNLGYSPENCYWATPTAQNRNQRIQKNNKTGIKGIFKRYGKFQVSINTNYKRIYLGCFETLTEAAIARKEGERQHWSKPQLT